MKVMLVYPKDIAENYQAKGPVLGIGYVGTSLAKQGHTIKLMDMRLKSHTNTYFKKVLKEFQPEIVGFSLVALSLEQAYQLMDIVKKESSAKVICGGPEVTLLPSKILSRSTVDFVMAGEGEFVFPEFLKKLENKEDYTHLPGLGWKDGNGNIVKINYPKTIDNLDSIPFPNWDLFPLKEYKRKVSKIKFPVMTSRGCPYNCQFCDSIKVNKGYRVRSPGNVADELELLKTKYSAKSFQILDDNFAIYKDRAIGICNEMVKRNLNMTWVVGQGFSPSKGNYDLFKAMKDAGCIVVYFGVESADDEVLRAINKPHTVAQVRNAVADAHRAGLIVKAPFIGGLPKSTYAKEKRYIEFFKETGIDMPKMGHLVPFPGTPMYDWVKNNAKMFMPLEKMHEDVSQTRGALDTDLFKPAFETDDYSYADRVKMLKEFQNESEKYILQKLFGKFLGYIAFKISRLRVMRKIGVKFLDIYYDQF